MSLKYLCTAALSVAVLSVANPASASLSLSLDDTAGTSFIVLDNLTGDSNPLLGEITFINGINPAGFNIPGFASLLISSLSNAPGTSAGANLNTTQIDVTTSTAKSLNVDVVDDGFSLPGAAGDLLNVTNFLSGTGLGTASISQTTELDGAATPVALITLGPGAVDITSANLTRVGATFTLATLISGVFGTGTSVSLTHDSLAVIPEPITMAIWAGLIGIGAVGIYRRSLKGL